jgi:hypothetical protein
MVAKPYSPLVRAGFVIAKWLSQFMAGMAIAYIISACLDAAFILHILSHTLATATLPILGIMLCLAALIIVIESWK